MGKGIANPYATILSIALLLRHSLGLEEEARAVERAIDAAIEGGARTADMVAPGGDRRRLLSTDEMGAAVCESL